MPRKRGLPEWGELVLCRVKRLTTFAAWCDLLEYPEVEGMIHISEVAGKWVRDIREHVKKGKEYVAKVIKIDYQRKHVNLSLKRVTPTEGKRVFDRFRKEQRAEGILEQAAKRLGKSLDKAYEEVGFALQEKFGSLAAAFEQPVKVLGVSAKWSKALKEVIEKMMKPKEVRIKAELKLTSFAGDGIIRIKKLLKGFEKRSKSSVKYISAPRYSVELTTTEPKLAERKLREELEKLIKEAKSMEVEAEFKFVR